MSNSPETGVFDAVRAYMELMRASRTVISRLEPSMAAHGLTLTQLGVLETLLHKGALTHRDLGRTVLTSAGNMTDVVDKLEARGLVRRVRDAADRRLVRVELTKDGLLLIQDLFPVHAKDIETAMGALSSTELNDLGSLLHRVGLSSATPDGGPGGGPGELLNGAAPLR
jgi:MarR family transcriptional regulator, 2-MHQ and catechol-resistance regulon repressor